MTASVHEAILQRVKLVLLAANIVPSELVSRGRVDAFSPDEMPAINIRRNPGVNNDFASGSQHQYMEFVVDLHVRGDDWETQADALHMQAHAALAASTELASLCKGLRCTRTEPSAEGGDQTIGAISATYQAQAVVRISDLTMALRG